MEFNIRIIGILLIALSFSHTLFPKYFKWQKELVAVSLLTRQIFYVHMFFIALALLLIGLLCLTSANEIAGTKLGNNVALGLGIFWATRLLVQFVGYSSRHWKGKRFETVVHILFSILWTYFSVVFFITYLQNKPS